MDFTLKDFHHLAGLQYLTDISSNIGTQNNSAIKCDYVIESKLAHSPTTVYIFLKHRNGIGFPCTIISFVFLKMWHMGVRICIGYSSR